MKRMVQVSCGCCSHGCCCANHQDVPNGRPVATCDWHKLKPHDGTSRVFDFDENPTRRHEG